LFFDAKTITSDVIIVRKKTSFLDNIVPLQKTTLISKYLYGLESLSVTRTGEKSLDFTFNRFMMNLFGTTDINVIKDCQVYFDTQPPSEILNKRRCKFLEKYRNFV